MSKPISLTVTVAALLVSLLSFGTAHAQDRARTWDFHAGLFSTDSVSLSGEQGSGLEVDDDVGFSLGGTYNFTNRWALGFSFNSISPKYDATFVPESGLPAENLRATLDAYTIQGRGVFNILEGPITPFVELGFGWTNVDSNIIDGPPVTGCWWDPWWGYICDTFFSTYSEDVTSLYAGAGMRWDISRNIGIKGSFGRLELDTGQRNEDPSLDVWRLDVIFRY